MRMHQLEAYLEQNFKPRCIADGEDPIKAHRYSAKVELAQQLLRLIRKDDEDNIEIEED
jgi:hypothetical protein